MSYEAWGDPDESFSERAGDLGYLDPDTVDEIRQLIKHVNIEPKPGDRSAAALVLIEYILDGRPENPDPTVIWADALLKDIP